MASVRFRRSQQLACQGPRALVLFGAGRNLLSGSWELARAGCFRTRTHGGMSWGDFCRKKSHFHTLGKALAFQGSGGIDRFATQCSSQLSPGGLSRFCRASKRQAGRQGLPGAERGSGAARAKRGEASLMSLEDPAVAFKPCHPAPGGCWPYREGDWNK